MGKQSVIILTNELGGKGGTESVIDAWTRMAELNQVHDIHVLIPFGNSNVMRLYAKNSRITINSHINHVKFMKKMNAVIYVVWHLLRRNPDIVIAISPLMVQLARIARRISGRKFKIVSWFHFTTRILTKRQIKQLCRADFHLAISTGLEKELILNGVPQNNIFCIYNPFTPSTSLHTIKRSADGVMRYVYVGRIDWNGQKNLQLLFNGLKAVDFYWTLDVYGQGSPEDTARIRDFLHENLLEECVHMHGWVDSPFSDIENADYLLSTSKFEGFGLSILESASVGLPVISSDCPVGPDDIVTPDNGYLFTNENKAEFVKALTISKKHANNFSSEKIKATVTRFTENNYQKLVLAALDALGD